MSQDDQDANAFNQAAHSERTSLVSEFIDFLKHNKKWWLLPIVLAVIVVGVLIALGATSAAPFIYPLF